MNDDKNREKTIELLRRLENNEIDQDTFNKEFDQFVRSEEFKNNHKRASKFNFSSLGNPWSIGFLVVIILFIVSKFYIFPYIGREYVVAKDYNNLDQPVQEVYGGQEHIKIDGVDVEVNLAYKYKIKGKVLATHHYLPTTLSNKLSPVDVGIAWGYILKEPNFKKIKCHETGTRRLLCMIGSEDIEGLYSNNHLVPSNDKVRKQMKKIKKDDYVQIEGYLVNMYWNNGNGEYFWESSISREDTGDGACELIYVTDVKWLKPEK